MVRTVKRRLAKVAQVQQLLGCLEYIKKQKQCSNLDRISRYMQREHAISESETKRQLKLAIEDGFIVMYTAVGKKGSKAGLEQEAYKAVDPPDDDEQTNDGYDWYCFECHQGGEVLLCCSCWRVYHIDCTEEDLSGSKFTCSVCKNRVENTGKSSEGGRSKNRLKRKMLNTLLSYTILRLKEKTRELHKIGRSEEERRNHRFIYQQMDLNTMEEKVSLLKYKSLQDYYADAQNIYHNIVLMYGADEVGGMTELSRIMLQDCKYDLQEIELCPSCYYLSNAKPKNWFCQPCDPNHLLVYAKQKGYGYWPAKVMSIKDEEMYDVRFFGGLHQRAVISKEHVKPIDTNIRKLTIKRTAGFVKACDELRFHQELLKKQEASSQSYSSDENQKENDDEEEADNDSSSAEAASDSNVESESEIPDLECEGGSDDRSGLSDEDSDSKSESSTQEPESREVSSSSAPILKLAKKDSSPDDYDVTSTVMPAMSPKPSPRAITVATACISTQTLPPKPPPKKLVVNACIQTNKQIFSVKAVQTDDVKPEKIIIKEPSQCNCKEKYEKTISDLKQQVKKDHAADKEKSLQELSDQLQKDFEIDKQQAVSRAVSNVEAEMEKIRQQAEDSSKEEYMEEMKKLQQKHKEIISATKKKQWCYNCEEEAMYHCCWNTSYCSIKCQQEHWHREHKRVCRRKR